MDPTRPPKPHPSYYANRKDASVELFICMYYHSSSSSTGAGVFHVTFPLFFSGGAFMHIQLVPFTLLSVVVHVSLFSFQDLGMYRILSELVRYHIFRVQHYVLKFNL